MEIAKVLRPLVVAELNPPMNVTLVTGESGLKQFDEWIAGLRAEGGVPEVQLDTETPVVHDFYFRRVRTIQIGNRERQFVFDLLSFAGSADVLMSSQGEYGAHNGEIYKPIFDRLDPILCTKDFLKVGQNLGFEYEVFHWNFGRRIWHLYSTDIAERVIRAGTIPLKKYKEFSMASLMARYFSKEIDKSEQKLFDLESPLTEAQILYAALDVRLPGPIKQAQMNVMTADQLLTTAQIENDVIGTYIDMHLVGQNLDDERWLKRIESVVARRQGELDTLDEGFIPLVGLKTEQIDTAEIERREKVWKEGFEQATPRELELAALKRAEKDKDKKAALDAELTAEKKKRSQAKAEARSACTELTKDRTKKLKIIEKCEGKAYLNYGSTPQLLEVLKKLPGMKNIPDTSDDTLLRFNDRPLIQVLRSYRKGKKETGTYGVQWTQRWLTKPLTKEGWRHPQTGRLHCIFNQLMAETGRTSSEKPNGQNLPQDNEVRACFICDPPGPDGDNCIVTIDMSGAELRIIAVLANARTWIEAFNRGWDVHSVSTEILYPVQWPAATEAGCAYFEKNNKGELKRQKCKCKGHKSLRDGTKAINFLLCYGGGPDALADALGVTLDAAKELMKLHESKFPDVWGYLRRAGELAKANHEARDMFGRRRSLPDPTTERCRDFFIEENEETLRLDEEIQAANILKFKMTNLRPPNEEEEYNLTHRNPTEKEVASAWRALTGRIGRQGKNHEIQGTNASIIKRAMGCGFDKNGTPYLWHTLPQFKARIQSMVHDELILHCPLIYAEQVAALVGDAFKRAAAEVMGSVVIMENDYHISHRWQK